VNEETVLTMESTSEKKHTVASLAVRVAALEDLVAGLSGSKSAEGECSHKDEIEKLKTVLGV